MTLPGSHSTTKTPNIQLANPPSIDDFELEADPFFDVFATGATPRTEAGLWDSGSAVRATPALLTDGRKRNQQQHDYYLAHILSSLSLP